ncbi:MAG: aldo/keto reductase [Oscillospiraceae bacterium]|nr:aldo/keto reductase [Oscillospiraceae bacterium]
MKYLNIGKPGNSVNASEISLGMMRISSMELKEIAALTDTALECGINFFDHADIYGGGKCEEMFAEAAGMNPGIREKFIIQTKCGIRQGFFDFSKEHILTSAEASLKRLKTDYIDILLLHRPDTLMEPEEVAEAFSALKTSGKVKYFGVSNQKPMQIKLLQKYLDREGIDIIINQLQLSVTNTGMMDSGLNVNMKNENSVNHDGDILEYCRLKDITIQPWSPFQHGFFGGAFIGDTEKFPELNKTLDKYAEQYGITASALAIAWLLRHPAKMQPIVGTTNKTRLAEICKASEITLSRREWYEIYKSAGNTLP